MTYFEIILLAFIEGLTEFIPVSSTGHLILANAFLKITQTDFTKAFNIIIQFGAILSVVYLYREKLKWNYNFYKNIFLAFIPTAVLGFLFKNKIDSLLDNTTVVAVSLILGGLVLVFIDSFFKNKKESELNEKKSVVLGLFQSIAMIPGVSRSAATIIGGQILGLSREKAAEFSFILAIPTLGAATVYKLWKIRDVLNTTNMASIGLGVGLSFVFSIFAIRFFITILNRFGFKYFGYYRIILGATVLTLNYLGLI